MKTLDVARPGARLTDAEEREDVLLPRGFRDCRGTWQPLDDDTVTELAGRRC
ncbi:MAG: hypothetical protein ABWX57_04070 [Aeromicrobium sp.]